MISYTRKNYRIAQLAHNDRTVNHSFWMTKESAEIVRRRFFGGQSATYVIEERTEEIKESEEKYMESNFVQRGVSVFIKLNDKIMPEDKTGSISKLLNNRREGVAKLCQPIVTYDGKKPHLLYSAFNDDGSMALYSVVEFEEILQ